MSSAPDSRAMSAIAGTKSLWSVWVIAFFDVTFAEVLDELVALFFAAFAAFLNPQARRGIRKDANRTYFLRGASSAMYIISCLKIKRLGCPSRVSRTIFLS